MPVVSRKNCNFAFQREATANRRGDPTTLSQDDLIPFELFEEIDLPETFEEFTEFWAVNSGRNVSDMIGEGIPVVDGTINYEAISGIPLLYALGKCVTTPGVAEISSFDTVPDVAGSLNNTYFTFTVVDSNTDDVDYYCWFNINAAGVDPAVAGKTGIEVAGATNVTANDLAAAIQTAIDALASVTVTNPGAPAIDILITNDELGVVTDIADGAVPTGFLNFAVDTPGVDNKHVITEDDNTDLPSLAFYFQQIFSGADALQNLIGVHCAELMLSLKKEAHVKGVFSCKIPKSIVSAYNAGAAITLPGKDTIGAGVAGVAWTAFNYPRKIFEWAHLQSNWTLILDSGNFLGGGAIDASGWATESADIKITNDLELLPVMGDPNFDAPSTGKREHEIVIFLFPETDVGRLLRKSHPEDYSCTLVAKIMRGQRDFVELTYSNLYVSAYPNKIPSIDDKSVGVETTLRNNVGGDLAIEIQDRLGKIYYEVY